AGTLNPRPGGRGFFPRLSGEVLAGQSRPGLDWEISSPEELSRRSLYAYVRRTMPVPMLDNFDYSNTTSPLSERPVTSVAPQALLLLNDAFMQDQAEALAERLESECAVKSAPPTSLDDAFIRRGFQLAVGRDPKVHEQKIAGDFIARQREDFAALTNRLTFYPDVPASLAVSYMDTLKPENFLSGPKSGWEFYRGLWSAPYESIRSVERDRGPFALATVPGCSNGVIEAKVFLHPACESAGMLFRASTKETNVIGYEVVLEPREQRLSLRRQAGEPSTLVQVPADIPSARSLPLKIQFESATIRVWLGDALAPAIEFTDPQSILEAGQIGARCWGAALSIDDLVLHPEGVEPFLIRDRQLAEPERRARQAFCLLLLNLNEVVYVD
ncbi:MAG TPA: hypothetical protein DCE44_23240, partial [Verrucomicrobiales bacterium]|nr:hypothetical protein [Verrucomicrobiales bacterium]